MLAHRQAKEIALGTDGKLRTLANLLAQHFPERTLIFTADNATVYRISHDFLIPAITHQTPVKERHEVLSKFRTGEYKTIVASHVLNEGVDVPDARVAIILSGTGSEREYIQRLGRVLRRGSDKNKLAILYEVVTENTTEEQTSRRRRGGIRRQKSPKHQDKKQEKLEFQQLEIVKPEPNYGINNPAAKLAAESGAKYGNEKQNDTQKSVKSQDQEQEKTKFMKLENIQEKPIDKINNSAAEAEAKLDSKTQNDINNLEHQSEIKKDKNLELESDNDMNIEDFF